LFCFFNSIRFSFPILYLFTYPCTLQAASFTIFTSSVKLRVGFPSSSLFLHTLGFGFWGYLAKKCRDE
jgi:hypothetical protein